MVEWLVVEFRLPTRLQLPCSKPGPGGAARSRRPAVCARPRTAGPGLDWARRLANDWRCGARAGSRGASGGRPQPMGGRQDERGDAGPTGWATGMARTLHRSGRAARKAHSLEPSSGCAHGHRLGGRQSRKLGAIRRLALAHRPPLVAASLARIGPFASLASQGSATCRREHDAGVRHRAIHGKADCGLSKLVPAPADRRSQRQVGHSRPMALVAAPFVGPLGFPHRSQSLAWEAS
jgi:hypothetical protein